MAGGIATLNGSSYSFCEVVARPPGKQKGRMDPKFPTQTANKGSYYPTYTYS